MNKERNYVASFWLTKSGPDKTFYHDTFYVTKEPIIREIAEELEGVTMKEVHITGIHEKRPSQKAEVPS